MSASRHRPLALVLTCEHAGNRVPAPYRALFAEHARLLASHRGWDPGALPLARDIARALGVPLLHHDVTRLLVEPNRSLHHPALFSAISRRLDPRDRQRALDLHYHPHRERVRAAIRETIDRGARCVHVGVHTFTPVLNDEVRRADAALLYDPRRALEREFCGAWLGAMHAAAPLLRLRRNYPYRGASDGLTTALRREFRAGDYLGIELEVNQALATQPRERARLAALLARTLGATLEPPKVTGNR